MEGLPNDRITVETDTHISHILPLAIPRRRRVLTVGVDAEEEVEGDASEPIWRLSREPLPLRDLSRWYL